VYIGPATREDKGFAHSYDVLVDSFQSEEDLSDPLFYKMSGRVSAHRYLCGTVRLPFIGKDGPPHALHSFA
jgi:hypothetical protein